MFTLAFLKSAGERAVKTFAQTILALVTVGPLVGITRLDWPSLGGLGATAATISVLTSITSLSTVVTPTVEKTVAAAPVTVYSTTAVPSGVVPDLPATTEAAPVVTTPDPVPLSPAVTPAQ